LVGRVFLLRQRLQTKRLFHRLVPLGFLGGFLEAANGAIRHRHVKSRNPVWGTFAFDEVCHNFEKWGLPAGRIGNNIGNVRCCSSFPLLFPKATKTRNLLK
jgi:hypothetical protein